MSSGIECLALKEQDVRLMVAAGMQLGARNADFQMEPYIFDKSKAGVNIFNLKKMWEKIMLAARAIAAVENPADVFAVASNAHAQRAVLKFAKYTGATAIAGRYTPGTLTNQTQTAFREPRLLIVSCPRADHQAITEARYVNVPVLALCNSDAPLRHVDISVPCNNSSINSIGLAWWLLTRQILRIRGTISHETDWEVMPDLFFHRTQEELEKDQKEEAAPEAAQAGAMSVPAPSAENWDAQPVPSVQAPAGVYGAVGQPAANTEDWGAADDSWGAPATTAGQDWGASAAPETNWG